VLLAEKQGRKGGGMSHARADIIISTFQGSRSIDATVTSIRRSDFPDFTLWILDQSCDDRTAEVITPHIVADARIRYLRVPVRGIAATRNAAAAMGNAPYLLFINDDCIADPGWVGAMVDELCRNQAALVFGRVLAGPLDGEHDGDKQMVLALKDWPQRVIYRGSRFKIDYGHGHNMAAPRPLFEQLGGFDEQLGAGAPFPAWDDLDIGYRVLAQGKTIVYTPEALVYHAHWIGWCGVRESYKRYGLGTGAAVGKYIRGGDLAALQLLLAWMLHKGLRQLLSGLLKRRSLERVRIGAEQLIYPLLGLARSLAYPVQQRLLVYCGRPRLRQMT